MSFFQSLLLGVVQGITEFLPVSSSGHLVVFQDFFGLNTLPLLFDILLHGATLCAVIVFFRKEIARIIRICFSPSMWKNNPDARILLFIIIGSVPTGIIALVGKELFEQAFHSVRLTGFMFFITAGLLLSTAVRNVPGKGILSIHPFSAFLIGCIQGMAILPGISRSGVTISLALLLGWKRASAFTFSFLLCIPAIAGALIMEGNDYIVTHQTFSIPAVWLIAIFSAFCAGLISLFLLGKTVQKKKLPYFSYYCFAVGTVVLIGSFL